MIGYTKGFILRRVTAKTKGLYIFLDDVNKISMKDKSKTDVREFLNEGGFLAAVYRKDSLKGYYCFRIHTMDGSQLTGCSRSTVKVCELVERFFSPQLPNETVKALDEELQCSFLEDIVTHRFDGTVFDGVYHTADMAPIWKTSFSGAIFGILVGLVLILVTRNTGISVMIGILWCAAAILISITSELTKQKDAIRTITK